MLAYKVFLAVAPTSAQVDQLKLLQAYGNNLHKVNPLNFHMTLFYLGLCDDIKLVRLREKLSSHRLPAFKVALDKIECWATPRAVCLTGKATDPRLMALAALIESICVELGCEKPAHLFKPHITILRKARELPSTLKNLRFNPLILAPLELRLYHSHSSPTGVQYDILNSWPLANHEN